MVFGNRRIIVSKVEGVKGSWRELHNEEIHHLYSPSYIARMIKSRRIRWAGHVKGVPWGYVAAHIFKGNPEVA
jgi:hypothetical protein